MNPSSEQRGFSAVEALITLFIGTLFIIAGYSLWAQVTRNGNEAAKSAAASDIAYEYLRKNSKLSTDCPVPPLAPTVLLPSTSIPNETVTGSIRVICSTPDADNPTILLIESTFSYQFEGKNEESVHAIYTTKL